MLVDNDVLLLGVHVDILEQSDVLVLVESFLFNNYLSILHLFFLNDKKRLVEAPYRIEVDHFEAEVGVFLHNIGQSMSFVFLAPRRWHGKLLLCCDVVFVLLNPRFAQDFKILIDREWLVLVVRSCELASW